MKNLFLILPTVLLLVSCGATKKSAKEIIGTYQGVLPCEVCLGIWYELELHEDFTYVERSKYEHKGEKSKVMRGNYTVNEKKQIELYKKESKAGEDVFELTEAGLEVISVSQLPVDNSPLKKKVLLKQ